MIPWPLVRVSWVDSYGPRGWSYLRPVIEKHDMTIESIGWLIQDEPDRITLAAHIQMSGIADGNPSVDGVMTIPRQAITEMQEWELA